MGDTKRALVTRLLDVDDWISGPELAHVLGVSDRTVRTYARSIPGIESSRYGYRANHKLARAWLASQRDLGPETPLERLYFIVRALLTGDGRVDIFELADALFVAPPTLEADLARARGLLRGHHLRIRRRGDELRVEGSEANQRALLRQLLVDSATATPVLTLEALQRAFPELDVVGVQRILQANLDRSGLRINPIVAAGALLHVLVALNRIQSGHPLPGPGTDHPVARDIAEDLEQLLHLEIPASERTYLAELLESRTGQGEATGDTQQLVQEGLAELSEEYQVELAEPSLIESLTLHVQSLIKRATRGEGAVNPFTAQIKQSHPLVYELGVSFSRRIAARTQIAIDEDESTFISMHLGTYFDQVSLRAEQVEVALLIEGYAALPPRAAARLRAALPPKTTVRIVTRVEEADRADLLVTNLAGLTSVPPTLVIDPMLSERDLERVRQRTLALLQEQRGRRFGDLTDRLLDPDLFYRSPAVSSPTELIALVSKDFVTSGVADPDIEQQILARESFSSTAFASGVAIPHPTQMVAKRSASAVVCFDEPLDWFGQPVSLVLFIAFSRSERGLFGAMFEHLIELLAQPEHVRALVEQGTDFESYRRAILDLTLPS